MWQRIKANTYWWFAVLAAGYALLLVRAVLISNMAYALVDAMILILSIVQFFVARRKVRTQ